MTAVGQSTPAAPTLTPSPDELRLRSTMITEEYEEVRLALLDATNSRAASKELDAETLAEIADGVADLIYVALGTTLALGIDLTPVWEAVQAANLTKASGPVREDGKRLKPPGFVPPDIAGLIARQMGAA